MYVRLLPYVRDSESECIMSHREDWLHRCLLRAALPLTIKRNAITGVDRPRGFQEAEAPTFQDSQHMQVVRLSALCAGHFYPPGSTAGTHFC